MRFLLDCARGLEKEGVPREDALMKAGRRLRPILMTTFALIAGMLPVAIGVGRRVNFTVHSRLRIIGGTITSTLLTLLVVPSFYDSIEIYFDEMVQRYKKRSEIGIHFWFPVTLIEFLVMVLLVPEWWVPLQVPFICSTLAVATLFGA